MEKLVLAIVHASRRLTRYFQGHLTNVLTNFRLNQVLSKPELSGRLAKWAIELGAHQITYKPRPAKKGQVHADFVTEVPKDRVQECRAEQDPAPTDDPTQVCTLFTDGAANDKGAGAG